jgi:uncharacterized protein (TIGR02996 family)
VSERESFLRAIRANPDDDTLRLVFADWLDEHGEPELAEFVRVQVELEPIHEQLDNPRVQELRERETVLLACNDADWLGPAADVADTYPAFGPVFRRGLPETVCLSLDTFLARGVELLDACPTLREVSLFDVNGGRSAELAACPHLGRVEKLEITEPGYNDDPDQIRALCQSLSATRVSELILPAVFNPHLIHELGRVIATGWPRWVTFVHYLDNGTNTAAYAAALDQIAGRPVTRHLRPYHARFPLHGEIGHGLYPGINVDGEPVLLAVRADGSGMWSMFEGDGRFDTSSTFGAISAEEIDSARTNNSGLIRIREFKSGGLSVHLWPQRYVNEYLRYPFDQPPGWTDRAWRDRGGVLKRWLHEGRFVIEWDGKDYWADSSGSIFGS